MKNTLRTNRGYESPDTTVPPEGALGGRGGLLSSALNTKGSGCTLWDGRQASHWLSDVSTRPPACLSVLSVSR